MKKKKITVFSFLIALILIVRTSIRKALAGRIATGKLNLLKKQSLVKMETSHSKEKTSNIDNVNENGTDHTSYNTKLTFGSCNNPISIIEETNQADLNFQEIFVNSNRNEKLHEKKIFGNNRQAFNNGNGKRFNKNNNNQEKAKNEHISSVSISSSETSSSSEKTLTPSKLAPQNETQNSKGTNKKNSNLIGKPKSSLNRNADGLCGKSKNKVKNLLKFFLK